MFPSDQLRTLLAVVDEGTFDAAAAALHVTPSAVSQRMKALEQGAGRVLLLRTKPVRLTESGRVVVRLARQLAQLERDAVAELGMADSGVPVALPIAVNADSLATWFLPALTRVPAQLRVCFELHREDQDHTTTLLREGLVMAAVTSSPEAVQGCSVRPLGRMRYLPVASPAFAERWLDRPLSHAVGEVPVVVFDRHDDLQDRFARLLTNGRDAGPLRQLVPSSEGFVDAVTAGMGWGVVPSAQARPRLEEGALVLLHPRRTIDVPLYWQQWKLESPALTATAAAVAEAAQAALDPPDAPPAERS